MGLAIFILVVFQVLVVFNRPHLPPPPDPNREDEEIEGGTANEDPDPSQVKSNICIAWDIIYRLFGAALMGYRYHPQLQ